MKNKYKQWCSLVFGLIILFSISFCGIKYIKHENKQDIQINDLISKNEHLEEKIRQQQDIQINDLISKSEYLEEKIRQQSEYYEYDTNYSESAFNYLAIGNSLTIINSWGHGICSTSPENDYVHLVTKYLEQKNGETVFYAYNFALWERAEKRETTLDLIDVFLDDKLDLVTIQLGENVSNLTNYKDDLIFLVEYVKNKCPRAEILIVGDWWNKDRNELRREAAAESNCKFADLSEIINNKDYQSKTGTECLRNDGTIEKVSEAASTHPGDKGMEFISKKIIEQLN